MRDRVALAALVLVLAGCASRQSNESDLGSGPVLVSLWFSDGVYITTEARAIPPRANAVVAALVEGPRGPGLRGPLLNGATVRTASRIARVTPNRPVTDTLDLQAIGRSLVGIEQIERVVVGSAELDFDETAVAPITVEQPAPGAPVSDSVAVAGTARALDGRIVIELAGPSGVLATLTANVPAGSRSRVPYRVILAFPRQRAGAPLRLAVHEPGPITGARSHERIVPLLAG